VIVRRAVLADLGGLAPLFDAYRRFYHQPADLERARQFLSDRLAANDSVLFVADAGGTLIGFVQLYPSFWSVAACRSWILNDLFVAPEARGTGAGRALMERAEAHARETGAGGLDLMTQKTNTTAQRLYESCGWVRDREFLHYERTLPPADPSPRSR
jgi:GNAT superfamily N-acetyltransferase